MKYGAPPAVTAWANRLRKGSDADLGDHVDITLNHAVQGDALIEDRPYVFTMEFAHAFGFVVVEDGIRFEGASVEVDDFSYKRRNDSPTAIGIFDEVAALWWEQLKRSDDPRGRLSDLLSGFASQIRRGD